MTGVHALPFSEYHPSRAPFGLASGEISSAPAALPASASRSCFWEGLWCLEPLPHSVVLSYLVSKWEPGVGFPEGMDCGFHVILAW